MPFRIIARASRAGRQVGACRDQAGNDLVAQHHHQAAGCVFLRGQARDGGAGTTIAGLAAQEDASRRLMVMLGDQIVTRLIAASPNLPSSP